MSLRYHHRGSDLLFSAIIAISFGKLSAPLHSEFHFGLTPTGKGLS